MNNAISLLILLGAVVYPVGLVLLWEKDAPQGMAHSFIWGGLLLVFLGFWQLDAFRSVQTLASGLLIGTGWVLAGIYDKGIRHETGLLCLVCGTATASVTLWPVILREVALVAVATYVLLRGIHLLKQSYAASTPPSAPVAPPPQATPPAAAP